MNIPGSAMGFMKPPKLPAIGPNDPFAKIVKALSLYSSPQAITWIVLTAKSYLVDELHVPSTFEQLRTTSAGNKIRVLVDHLVANVTNPALINALLTLKWHFSTLDVDDRGLNETRANACEIIAWRFLTRLSERDAVDFCLYELPEVAVERAVLESADPCGVEASERTSLLPQFRAWDHPRSTTPTRPGSKRAEMLRSVSHMGSLSAPDQYAEDEDETDPTSSFTGLNALEIAAVADCKKFLSQRIVQKIITGIWRGDITFWAELSVQTKKKPQFYNKKRSDPFTRLRVPRYIKAFEILFFATFLFLYYAVLVERNPYHVNCLEVILYIWFAAFSYDELGEFIDAGSIFYAVDIWNGCDIIIILVGAAFAITRFAGIYKNSDPITDTAFDILSLEALFMVPRICSLLSLHPYFGTLIPCLKQMTKDFVKFMVVVAVLYIGFLTTFTLLARDNFSLSKMSWILIKVFFGSSYLGFDIMSDINPKLGPPLMLIFVCMTNILLITSLISILSDSFSRVIAHAREEYLFVYSVYVLEASTSNRLTHFYPPLNLIPLILIRPLRLFLSADDLRRARIVTLKITHSPIVAAIWVFEKAHEKVKGGASAFSTIGPGLNRLESLSGSSAKTQRPFLTNRKSGKRGSQHFPIPDTPNTEDGARSPKEENGNARGKKEGEQVVVVSNAQLENQVRDLSVKIAELTALIMAQQGTPQEE
ncbi:receptor-activated Ca2+-permeable cation channel [Diplocarpon rosae]|nr:receptor-activated Ca2+-permeable cation channel [Diplocarpon rosae]